MTGAPGMQAWELATTCSGGLTEPAAESVRMLFFRGAVNAPLSVTSAAVPGNTARHQHPSKTQGQHRIVGGQGARFRDRRTSCPGRPRAVPLEWGRASPIGARAAPLKHSRTRPRSASDVSPRVTIVAVWRIGRVFLYEVTSDSAAGFARLQPRLTVRQPSYRGGVPRVTTRPRTPRAGASANHGGGRFGRHHHSGTRDGVC